MGSVGSAFGRNLRPHLRPDLFDEPSPILVSQQLLHRDTFLPARSLNLLAAAWIQFQVHDWVDHARYPLGQADVRVPLLPGMTWSNTPGGPLEHEMRIAGNIPFAGSGHNPMSPVFPNATTPWWDASELYGADAGHEQPAPGRREAAAHPAGVPARRRERAGDHRVQRELVAGTRQPAHALRARAQPALR